MNFTIKLSIEDDNGAESVEEIIQINKDVDDNAVVGLSLPESKQILKKKGKL